MYTATLEGVGRTNNTMESWHSACAGRSNASHPTFSTLVDQLKSEQGLAEFIVTKSLAQGYGPYTRSL